ncbi:MAG: hypothetical protein ACMUIP_13490 [bacterium]
MMRYILFILGAFLLHFLISVLLALEITRHHQGGSDEFGDNLKYSLFIVLFIITIPVLLGMVDGYLACIWLLFVFAPYGLVGIFEKSIFKHYHEDNLENSSHPFSPHKYILKKIRS